jgi:RecB family endonuclease NucS
MNAVHPLVRLLRAVIVVAVFAAGLVVVTGTIAARQAEAASSVGGQITRAEVIARARYWYERGDTWYSQDQADAISDGDGHSYRPDCSGLVAMAWHLPKKSDGWDLNTSDFHSWDGKTWLGSLHDLLPGDAVLKSGHMELFEKWVDENDHSRGAWVYSENDYGQKTNHNINSWSEMTSYRGIRYDNIADGSGGTPGSGRIGIIKFDGTALVKEGALNAGWKDMLPGGVIKDISVSGDRIGIVKQDGTVLVKEGALNAGWKDMLPGGVIKDVELSGDRIAIIKQDGSVLVKEGALNTAWKDMLPGAVMKDVALAGNRVGIVKHDGTVLVKEGELNAGWKDMLPGGVMTDVELAGDRVAVIKQDGSVLVKEGALNTGWKDMLPGGVMKDVALAGNRVGIVKHDGTVLVKEGELNAGWKDMLPGGVMTDVELAGNRVAIIKQDGSVLVKEGALNTGWKDMLPGGVMNRVTMG